MDAILTVFKIIGVLFLVIMVFNFMILIHELGHFLAAKWRGLVVDRFFIWFGPPIWKKKVNGVLYGLGCVPFGGYVSLPQMLPMEAIEGKIDEEVKKEELPPCSPLDKIIVAAAGPLFSFLLAVVFAVIAWGIKTPKNQSEITTIIGTVEPGSAADKAGIKSGDKVISIAGKEVEKFGGMGNSVRWHIVSAPIGPLDMVIERDGKRINLQPVLEDPKEARKEKQKDSKGLSKLFAAIFDRPPLPSLGISPRIAPYISSVSDHSPASEVLKKGDKILEMDGKTAFVDSIFAETWKPGQVVKFKILRKKEIMEVEVRPRRPEHVRIDNPEKKARFEAKPIKMGIGWDPRGDSELERLAPTKIIADGAKSIYSTLKKVFSPKSSISGSHLSGPVGIGGLLFDFLMMDDGWRLVIFFGALLNINLAILNMLPFPVLDGGHIVMATTEWIRRKPTPIGFFNIVQTGFFFLLFGFMIFITFKDIGDRSGKKEVYEIRFEPLKKDSA